MSTRGIDVHRTHPTDCEACVVIYPLDFACLEHSCPDCGSIVWNEMNEVG